MISFFNGIAISNKAELRFPYTGQVMDFTPDYSLKEIGPFVNAKGPIFVVKLTYDENFTH